MSQTNLTVVMCVCVRARVYIYIKSVPTLEPVLAHYKNQSFYALWRNNWCLLCNKKHTTARCMDKMRNF